jgi:hypothetical protein
MANERGQVTPLLALVVVAIGGLIWGMARFGATTAHAARAQAAADAAALAGAADDRGVAEAVADDNGAEVVTYAIDGREVEVRTRVGDTWAVARARRAGGGRGVTGWVGTASTGGDASRLHPEVRRALAAAAELLDQPVPVAGGGGRAVDVPRTFAARLASVAPRVGLCRLTSQNDPVRFVPCQSSRA